MLIKALEEIEAAPRGKKRLEAITELLKTTPHLQRFLVEANHPFVTFGVAKLPEPGGGGLFFQNDEHWVRDLFAITARLADRTLTGNDAKAHIARHLDDANELQKKWATRLLLRDLRLNIGAKDLQKILGKTVVPIFEVPLAKSWDDVPEDKDPKGNIYAIQPKLDGARCVAMISADGSVELLSRTGKTWGNFESIRKSLVEYAARANLPKPYVLDGEVVSLDAEGKINFQQLQKTQHRKSGSKAGIEVGTLQYVVFDGCQLAEWMNPQQTYSSRFFELKTQLSWHPLPANIKIVDSSEGFYRKADLEVACKAFMAQGYEGAMARKYGAVVENKRSKSLIKVKLFKESEALIYDVVEGTGKYKGMMGALKCRWPDGSEFEIGTGPDDEDRKDMWENKPIGLQATFKYFEVTDAGVPRLPVFKAVRHSADVIESEDE